MMLESRESASPILTRSIAAALDNKYVNPYQFSHFENLGLRAIGYLPKSIAARIIPRLQSPLAHDPKILERLSIEALIQERLEDYHNLHRKFPALVFGSALGGAIGHICSLVKGIFVPHVFVLTLQGSTQKGNIREYIHHSKVPIERFLEKNRNVEMIQHFDPIHDGWLTKSVNHVRFKLMYLPEILKVFIKEYLMDGGEIIFLNGRIPWLQFQISLNWFVQVGGWGGITDCEYINGSSRIDLFCQENKLYDPKWKLDECPIINGVESEWGSNSLFCDAIKIFCQKHGYKYTEISFKDPHVCSKLAFFGKKTLLEKCNINPSGTIIEMFSQYDITASKRSALLPLWLIFNTIDCLEMLKSMKKYFPKAKPIFFSPLATFSNTPDIVQFEEWEKLLPKNRFKNIGARKTHYPQDTHALIEWFKPLREWVNDREVNINENLSGDDLQKIFKEYRIVNQSQ